MLSQAPACAVPRERACTATFEMAPKLIAETLNKLSVVKGLAQPDPIVTAETSEASRSSVGNGVLTKIMVPVGFKSRVEPKAIVRSTFLAAR